MNLMEKVRRYIKISNVPETVTARYMFRVDEVEALLGLDHYDALSLAFQYGRAKGYRAGKAAAR